MKLKIFHWIDGPPAMNMDLGWYWQLEDDAGKLKAESPGRFEDAAAARNDASTLFDLDSMEVVELGKFNPDEPSEWVDGEYRGPHK